MSIANFSWVIPGKLAGSAIPGGSRSDRKEIYKDLGDLVSKGIQCLVSLERPHGAIEQLCDEVGLTWVFYPIPDFSIPEDPAKFDQFILDIVRRIGENEPVCVHCRAGIGRTGLVLSCAIGKYLALGSTSAIKTVRHSRQALDTEEQTRFVEEYLGEYEN